MDILLLIIGLAAGAAIGYLAARSRYRQPLPFTKEELDAAREDSLRLRSESAQYQEAVKRLEASLSETKGTLETERQRLLQASRQLSEAQADNRNLVQRIEEQKKELEATNQRLTAEFRNIANAVLEEKARSFSESNRTSLDTILSPLRDRLEEFKRQVEATYEKEMRETLSLKEEVKRLAEQNTRITEEASNLTRALKGDTKTQGNWGEFILEKILERSGLEKEREYRIQLSTRNADGETIRPDVVVLLPDNKHIIIDSKVSLTAYEAYIGAATDELRAQYMKEHLQSFKNHVKLLSEKNYQTAELLNAPDFVLMFVPIESSFSVAVQADQELFAYAWERKIIVVSPATLLATLRTIASIWKQEKQTRNALDIAKQGGALYDKFVGFAADLTEVGKKMDSAKESYKDAMSKLVEGRGNILRSIENLKVLGAKTTKAIDQKLLDRSDEA